MTGRNREDGNTGKSPEELELNAMLALIEEIYGASALELEDNSALIEAIGNVDGDFPVDLEARFREAVRLPCRYRQTEGRESLVEAWLSERRRPAWMERLRAAWLEFGQRLTRTGAGAERLLEPMGELWRSLDGALQPAPAVRSAGAVREWVYPPKRRGIGGADLPVLNPLFCTAIEARPGPVSLAVDRPGAEYEFILKSADNPAASQSRIVRSSAKCVVAIDYAGALRGADAGAGGVWFLRRAGAPFENGANWTSGLIWILENARGKEAGGPGDLLEILPGGEDTRSILEMNLLLAEGFYVRAYDLARQWLMYRRNETGRDPVHAAAVWKTAEMALAGMADKLRRAEPAFQSVHPGWNGAESIRALLEDIRERD